MPITPRFTENTQRSSPEPSQRFRAADFGSAGELIGRAVQGAGRQLENSAKDLLYVQDAYDTAAAKKADTASLREIAEVTARYTSLEGFAAVDAQQKATEEIEAIRKKHMSGLANPRQQAMFGDVYESRIAPTLAKIQAHETTQVIAAEKAEAGARAKAYADNAMDNADNPEVFDQSVGTVYKEIENVFKGAGPEVLAQKKAEALSSIHAGVVQRMLTDPDQAMDAQAYLNAHAGDILPADETALRKTLQPTLEEAETDANLGMVLAEMGSANAASDQPEQLPEPATPAGEGEREAQGERAAETADPLRGRGGRAVPGGEFGASRDGGRREHTGYDFPAPAGTPIYPPMSGTVVSNEWHEGGGWSVRIKHPNGRITGYAHMRSKSPLEVGKEVTARTVIGAVGNTGASSSGDHLHYTVTTPEGQKVDPTKVKWAEAGDWKEPEPQLYTPERNDKAALYAAAHRSAVKNNWSTREYDAVLRRIDTMVAREDNLRSRAIEAQTEAAWETVVKLGDNFTSISQVPGFGALPAAERDRLQNRAEQNVKGTEPEAYGETYLDLLEMSADPTRQEEFKRIDIRRINDITKGERASLVRAQAGMQGGTGEVDSTYSRINTAINQYKVMPGYDRGYKTGQGSTKEDARKNAKLTERVRKRVAAEEERLGRKLSDPELDGIVRGETIVMTVSTPGFLGTSEKQVPRYLADEVEGAEKRTIKVPIAERDAIVAAYQRRNGGAVPSDQQITTMYLRGLGR